jgi:hypothetical protein
LRELTETRPLKQGLAELVVYLELGSGKFKTKVDESMTDIVTWQGAAPGEESVKVTKQARLPRILFLR